VRVGRHLSILSIATSEWSHNTAMVAQGWWVYGGLPLDAVYFLADHLYAAPLA
jgi:hypothetical protein